MSNNLGNLTFPPFTLIYLFAGQYVCLWYTELSLGIQETIDSGNQRQIYTLHMVHLWSCYRGGVTETLEDISVLYAIFCL